MCKQVLLLRKQNHHKMRKSPYPVLLHRIVYPQPHTDNSLTRERNISR